MYDAQGSHGDYYWEIKVKDDKNFSVIITCDDDWEHRVLNLEHTENKWWIANEDGDLIVYRFDNTVKHNDIIPISVNTGGKVNDPVSQKFVEIFHIITNNFTLEYCNAASKSKVIEDLLSEVLS